MADQFFEELVEKRMAWVAWRSAFSSYRSGPAMEDGRRRGLSLRVVGGGNMNRRMIELQRKNWEASRVPDPERERCYRHMISERRRREKQRQNYSALHALLPHGTKGDKRSVIEAAAVEIQRLQRHGEDLRTRNRYLEGKLGSEGDGEGAVWIGVRVAADAASAIDATLRVAKRLKDLGVETNGIRAGAYGIEVSVVLDSHSLPVWLSFMEQS